VLAIILSAIAYNKYSSMQQEAMLEVVLNYNQGKTVKCEGIDVNKDNFTLSIGTYTFIGKKGTKHYARMINASECKLAQ
jgi:hypothetical protein